MWVTEKNRYLLNSYGESSGKAFSRYVASLILMQPYEVRVVYELKKLKESGEPFG